MSARQFTLFKRKDTNFYYVRFRMPDGTRSGAKSSGCIKKRDAENWAIEKLRSFGYLPNLNVTLEDFAGLDFFEYATGKYCQENDISRAHALIKNHEYQAYVYPYFKDYSLNDINTKNIKEFRNLLISKRNLASGTIRRIFSCLRPILVLAEEEGIISGLPTFPKIVKNKNNASEQKERGILSLPEWGRVFQKTHWPDDRSYVCNLLASFTGIRMGEALGLQIQDIIQMKKNGQNNFYLEINKSYEKLLGELKSTKSGKPRIIPIHPVLMMHLKRLVELNPYRGLESFLFFSLQTEKKPLDHKVIRTGFYKALKNIGIEEETRQSRGIVFHSHRHFANTYFLESGQSLLSVQATIGHEDKKMSQNYYHLQELDGFVQAQEGLVKLLE